MVSTNADAQCAVLSLRRSDVTHGFAPANVAQHTVAARRRAVAAEALAELDDDLLAVVRNIPFIAHSKSLNPRHPLADDSEIDSLKMLRPTIRTGRICIHFVATNRHITDDKRNTIKRNSDTLTFNTLHPISINKTIKFSDTITVFIQPAQPGTI